MKEILRFDFTKKEIPKEYDKDYFQVENFNIEEEIKNLNLPLVEIGGPTPTDYDLIKTRNLDKKLYISNIDPGLIKIDPQTKEFLGYKKEVDFRADARKMPLKKESVGAVFAAYLPKDIRTRVMGETSRVLVNGGLLVWEGGNIKDFKRAEKNDFKIMQYLRKKCFDGSFDYQIIFRKENLEKKDKKGN